MPQSARYARLLTRETRRATPQESPMVARAAAGAGPALSRGSNLNVVTQPVNFKASVGAKASQAWRYPGFNILRAPSVFLTTPGKLYTDPKEPDADNANGKPRRKIESNFFITINPNQKVPAAKESRAQAIFKTALDKIAREENLVQYLKFGPKDSHYIGDHAIDVIEKLDWDSNVEIGDIRGRMHCHIWLTIVHYSQIQINVSLMQWAFKKAYNEQIPNLHAEDRVKKLPYLQVKLLPQSDWTTVMRQYIKKAIGAGPVPAAFEARAA